MTDFFDKNSFKIIIRYSFINWINMAIQAKQCESMLANQLVTDFSQQYNLSKLTTSAWSKNKAECFSQMWWLTNIKNFISQIQKDYKDWNLQINTIKDEFSDNVTQTVVQTDNSVWWVFWYSWNQIWNYVSTWLLILIFIYLAWKIVKYGLRYAYSFINQSRFVYLKVMLPRGDNKLDREQDKELAKDMKEKIWRMSQVYMNFHKITELSTRDTLMYKIFSKQKIVMMYHYEWWLLNFVV